MIAAAFSIAVYALKGGYSAGLDARGGARNCRQMADIVQSYAPKSEDTTDAASGADMVFHSCLCGAIIRIGFP